MTRFRELCLAACTLLSCASARAPRVEETAPVVSVPAAESPPPAPVASAEPARPATSTAPSAPAKSATVEDPVGAKSHFQEGVRAYSEGRYGDARRSFEKAYALAPRSQILFNLAMADLKDGDLQSACLHYEQWTKSNPGPAPRGSAAFAQCPGGSP